MSNNQYIPTSEKCFISALLDEWLQDSHCLDTQEAWDADPKRPFPSEVIMLFLKYSGLSVVEDLGRPMMEQSHARIHETFSTYGISPERMFHEYSSVKGQGGGDVMTRKALLQLKMVDKDIDVILRLATLCINVLNSAWPYGYTASSGDSDDNSMDAEGDIS